MSEEPQQPEMETESMTIDNPIGGSGEEQAPEPTQKKVRIEGVSVGGTSRPEFTNSSKPLNEYKTISDMKARRVEILAECDDQKVPLVSQPSRVQIEYFDLIKKEEDCKQQTVEFINVLRDHGLPEEKIGIWTDMMVAHDMDPRMQDLACEFVACNRSYGSKRDEDLRKKDEELKRVNKRAHDAELQVSELQKKGTAPVHQQKTAHSTTTTTNNHNGATTTLTKQTKAVDSYYGAFPPKINTIGKQRSNEVEDPVAWGAFISLIK